VSGNQTLAVISFAGAEVAKPTEANIKAAAQTLTLLLIVYSLVADGGWS
jgi:hypothetical protein